MQYLIDNKEWIFSGIGATIFALVITYLIAKLNRITKKSNTIKRNDISLEKSHSNNIQLINNQINTDIKKIDWLCQETFIALRELYRRFDLTLKSVELGLAPLKLNPPKSNSDYLNDAIVQFNEFSDYYDRNEILFDSCTTALTVKIKNLVFCMPQTTADNRGS